MRWYPPYVEFQRQVVFCMNKSQAHDIYDLPDSGTDARLLTEADFKATDWLQCFKQVPKRGNKVKCRDVLPEHWARFYTVFTSVYQEPPTNYGMEVTKVFARGFLFECLKGQVNWAQFAEDIVTNLDSLKLQAKKQRWAAFHSSTTGSLRQKLKRGEVTSRDTPPSTVHDVRKELDVGSPCFEDMDKVFAIASSKHGEAQLELKEATEKLEVMRADAHRHEGASHIVHTLREQLKDANAELERLQDSTDVEAKKQLTLTVSKLSTTLLTLETVVVDNSSADTLSMAQLEVEWASKKEKYAGEKVDFVRRLQANRRTFLLCVPPPKVPRLDFDMGSFASNRNCNGCGLVMDDEVVLGTFVMPCSHAYHMYCFADIATSKDKCMAIGCMQPISHAMRSLVVLDNTDASCPQAASNPSSVPIKVEASISKPTGTL